MLKVGVVGLGIWGRNHPLVYEDYHRSQLAVVCDLDAERARAVAEQYRCEWTTDVGELAASDVEAFSVATPDHTHFEPARALISAGKHVLIEKPLTTDLAQARELARLDAAHPGTTMVDFHLRWDPQWTMVKEAVESGGIGAPVMGYIRLSDAIEVAESWLGWAGRSGPHWFLFPHTMDLVGWITGQRPRRVYASGRRGVLSAKGIDTWDCIQAIVDYDSAQVTFETSWIVPNSNPSVTDCHMTLYGSTGRIEYDQDFAGLSFATDRYTYPWVPLGKKDRYGQLDHFMYKPIRYFVDCVLDGSAPECTVADGVANVELIDAVVRSLDTGAPVLLPG